MIAWIKKVIKGHIHDGNQRIEIKLCKNYECIAEVRDKFTYTTLIVKVNPDH